MTEAPSYRSPDAVETVGEAAERQFERVWARPRGIGSVCAVNNSVIGRRFIVTGFIFFLIGGVLALLMRTQLIVPENDFLSAELYNQIFTMHGTTMMFLFAVPIMEAFGVYLIPSMLGARDLCFPRLSAFGYWCFLFGGILLYSSFLFGGAPDGGWFMYVPLVDKTFSPGINQDFWLLGVTFVEVSSIAGAIELATSILKTRAPGMSLNRMPIFAWYMLAVSFMIIIGFPPLVLGSIFLEAQRAFGIPFFEVSQGGSPLLWQHLFWIFGHPEVYIIFLPAAGLVSAMLPALVCIRLIGYHFLVLAVIGTAFLSFGLWVHHMYATGIPRLALTFFAGASLAVAIPSGIQVFTWLAMLWEGRPSFRTPLLYIIGFIVIFVIGGLTGVMVAMVPFDWQVHDTYFVVAHFHYVLIGGMVFPLLAALTYFVPRASGRLMSEPLGHLSFWLVFIGFNTTFFPMHLTGMLGMPRRIATYPTGFPWWDTLNLISTLGSYVIAVGVAVFVFNFVTHYRWGAPSGINPWNASSLEWANEHPTPPYNLRSIPEISSLEPLTDQKGLLERILSAREFLPTAEEGKREMLVSSAISAAPQYVIRLPHPTIVPLLAAIAAAGIFVGILVSFYALAWTSAAFFLLISLVWLWQMVPEKPEKPIGKGLVLPIELDNETSVNWMGPLIALMADAALFSALVFSHYYLWTVAESWPPPRGFPTLGPAGWASATATVAVVACAGAAHWAARRRRTVITLIALLLSALLLVCVLVLNGLAYAESGLSIKSSAYAATAVALGLSHGIHAFLALIAALFAIVRLAVTGRSLPARIFALLTYYMALQGAVVFAVVYLSPHVLS